MPPIALYQEDNEAFNLLCNKFIPHTIKWWGSMKENMKAINSFRIIKKMLSTDSYKKPILILSNLKAKEMMLLYKKSLILKQIPEETKIHELFCYQAKLITNIVSSSGVYVKKITNNNSDEGVNKVQELEDDSTCIIESWVNKEEENRLFSFIQSFTEVEYFRRVNFVIVENLSDRASRALGIIKYEYREEIISKINDLFGTLLSYNDKKYPNLEDQYNFVSHLVNLLIEEVDSNLDSSAYGSKLLNSEDHPLSSRLEILHDFMIGSFVRSAENSNDVVSADSYKKQFVILSKQELSKLTFFCEQAMYYKLFPEQAILYEILSHLAQLMTAISKLARIPVVKINNDVTEYVYEELPSCFASTSPTYMIQFYVNNRKEEEILFSFIKRFIEAEHFIRAEFVLIEDLKETIFNKLCEITYKKTRIDSKNINDLLQVLLSLEGKKKYKLRRCG